MNLVALLLAPLVVSMADDTVARIAIAVVAALIVAGMIWYSKSMESESMVEPVDAAKEPASA